MDAVRLLMQIELRNFPFAHHHAAHAGSDNDADAMGRFFLHVHS